MTVQPSARSIQTMYRMYRDGQLIVNRRYQRKLVWTLEEKRLLINSIFHQYPIPLFILAEISGKGGSSFEIIDGMQRLDAIFSFVEGRFSVDGKYFDLRELARAKQALDSGEILIDKNIFEATFPPKRSADFVDYNLAVTIFPSESRDRVNEIFGRINANGQQLSEQDRRQAGSISRFNNTVRAISATIRGDETKEVIDLRQMPSVSVDTPTEGFGYAVNASKVFWCRQGIVRAKDLRSSEDEQVVADLTASALIGTSIKNEKSDLDFLYDGESKLSSRVETALINFGEEEFKSIFVQIISKVDEIVASHPSKNTFRDIVTVGKTRNPARNTFHAFFLAIFRLTTRQDKWPVNNKSISMSIEGLQNRIERTRGGISPRKRDENVNVVIGLIQDGCSSIPSIQHFPHHHQQKIEIRNLFFRYASELARFEFKQGLRRLDKKREIDRHFLSKIPKHCCAIANSCPETGGMLIIGIADSESDKERIVQLYPECQPEKICRHWFVGVEREILDDCSRDEYLDLILGTIRESSLSDELKSGILDGVDWPNFANSSLILIRIPPQKDLAFLSGEVYWRDGNQTKLADSKKVHFLSSRF